MTTLESSDERIEFLVITDQKDSSKQTLDELKPRTKRHFESFIAALPDGAKVVKNIGDSLMVRLHLPVSNVVQALLKIVRVQASLAKTPPDAQHPAPIRVVIMLLGSSEWIDGKDILYPPADARNEKIRHLPAAEWLHGDVFGPAVALAFRAANIPTDPIIVIHDEIIRRIDPQFPAGSGTLGSGADELHIGPRLAFSPFKGLGDTYKFAGGGPHQDSWWKGHLYLRMIGTDNAAVSESRTNKLMLDQQRVRVFTELAWFQPITPAEISQWKTAFDKIEGGAGYVRSLSRIRASFGFPSADLVATRKARGLIVIGAYPNQEAYATIRERIEEEQQQAADSNFAYPLTTEVYSPPESKVAFWTSEFPLSDTFVLMFARFTEAARQNNAKQATLAIAQILGRQEFTMLTQHRCGLIVGELWDVYSILKTTNGFPEQQGQEALFKRLFTELEKNCFAAASFKVCESLTGDSA